MTTTEIEKYKTNLLKEKAGLEQQLSRISKKDSGAAGGWDATPGNIEVDPADENELADKLEELDENNSIVAQLDNQLNEVKAALERIEKGTFGLCGVCGEPIEIERLEANPSSSFSIKHGHTAPEVASAK